MDSRLHIQKKSTVLILIVLRCYPTHYQQCYHDRLTRNVTTEYMVLLISTYASLIFMEFLLIHLQTKFYFFHIENDIINIRCWYCSVSIVIFIACVYDIVYQILK